MQKRPFGDAAAARTDEDRNEGSGCENGRTGSARADQPARSPPGHGAAHHAPPRAPLDESVLASAGPAHRGRRRLLPTRPHGPSGATSAPPRFGRRARRRNLRLQRAPRFADDASVPEPRSNRRPWYRNHLLVGGLGLLALGAGNWITGTMRLRDIATSAASRPSEPSVRGHEAAANADVELVRAHQEFYHVVATGGRLFTATGIVLSALGLMRARRDDARSATTTESGQRA